MTKRRSAIFIVSGFAKPSEERVGLKDTTMMSKKFRNVRVFHKLDLIEFLKRDWVNELRKGETIVEDRLKCFFDSPGIHNFMVHYTGHGNRRGDWWLPDESYITLKRILAIWSRRQHRSTAQTLLLTMDSCHSGVNIRRLKRLNRYHPQGEYENVKVIGVHGVAKYDDSGSDLTKAICRDKPCPVGTACTRSLMESNPSEPVTAIRSKRNPRCKRNSRCKRSPTYKCCPRLRLDWKR